MAKPTLIWSGLAVGLVAVLAAPIEGRQTAQAGAPQPIASGFGKGAYRPGPGIRPPVIAEPVGVHAVYTKRALTAAIQGSVELEAVVELDGAVFDVQVVSSLDSKLGLDDAAKEAAKKLMFVAAQLNGNDVRAVVTLIFAFTVPPNASTVKDEKMPEATIRMRGATTPSALQRSLPPMPEVRPIPHVPGIVEPQLLKQVEPNYTSNAMRLKIEGTVELYADIRADGTVDSIRVTKSLDAFFGLDREAENALRKWIFKPAMLDGRSVARTVNIEMSFRLH